jgi:hypothetical protein
MAIMFPDLNVCGKIHDLQIKFQKVFLQITEFGLSCIAESFLYQYEISCSWDSSVGIAMGYWLDDQGGREFESR